MTKGAKSDIWWVDDLPACPHVKAATIAAAPHAESPWSVNSTTVPPEDFVKKVLEEASIEKLEEYGEIIIKRLEELRNE